MEVSDLSRYQLISANGTVEITNGKVELYDTQTETNVMADATEELLAAFGVSLGNPNPTSSVSAVEGGQEQALAWKGKDNAVLKLINLWHLHQGLFKSTTMRNDEVWKRISVELQATDAGWRYTWQQCKDKVKYIRKEYMKVKDNNSKSGNAPKTCHFYHEMDEILGDKPCVTPVSVASSSKKRALPTAKCDMTSGESTNEESEEENRPAAGNTKAEKPIKKRKKSKVEKQVESWTNVLREDAKKREEARASRFERSLQVYEDTMKKLIDKL